MAWQRLLGKASFIATEIALVIGIELVRDAIRERRRKAIKEENQIQYKKWERAVQDPPLPILVKEGICQRCENPSSTLMPFRGMKEVCFDCRLK